MDLYGKEDAPALHESPSYGCNSWCQHGITGRISSQFKEKSQMGGKGSTMNSTATCSTWRGMGSARLYFAQDSPCDDNIQPYHTGSVAARVNKDRAFRRTPGRRCQMCYWCIIEDSRTRQHHHRHLEHEDTRTCRETSGTDTRNGQVQREHPWTL